MTAPHYHHDGTQVVLCYLEDPDHRLDPDLIAQAMVNVQYPDQSRSPAAYEHDVAVEVVLEYERLVMTGWRGKAAEHERIIERRCEECGAGDSLYEAWGKFYCEEHGSDDKPFPALP